MPRPSIHLASLCYEGRAQARFMRSLLALGAECAAREIPLKLDLSGGEALVGRGRAGVLARFLAGEATHLVFAEADAAFAPQAVLELVSGDQPVAATAGEAEPERRALLMIRRDAGERLAAAHPELSVALGDLHGASGARAPMLFESIVDPASGRYLADVEAFLHRWARLADPD